MIRPISSLKIDGRRVIVRVGFDVPLKQNIHSEESEVADETRIKDALPTLKYLIDQQARIVIASHLNRPKGWEKGKSLWPAAVKLGELLNYKTVKVTEKLPQYAVPHIYFLTEDITKVDYSKLSKDLPAGSILFLENLRFYPGEQGSDEQFAKTLATFGDIYVNEAFSDSHRKDSSVFVLPKLLPSYAGMALTKELSSLHKVLKMPAKPMVLLLGGAKIDDKVATLNHLAPHLDHILIGGAIANTFFQALGYEVGQSKVSDVSIAKEVLRNYRAKLMLPVDLVVATGPTEQPSVVKPEKVLPNQIIYDVGPETIRKFSLVIKQAKTLAWNGPFGLIENPKFAHGSKAIAQAFASRSKGPAFGLIGGGETIQAADMAHVTQFIDHVSMGGGAMLEFLAGKSLPAIKILETNAQYAH